jgi:hypothetical protein
MSNVADFKRTTRTDVVTLQGLYLRAWAQATDEKCGPKATIELLEFQLERARKRGAAGGNNG